MSKNETMNAEVAIEKCDIMGANLSVAYREAAAARASVVKNNEKAVMDYITGKSDENPCAAITDAVKAKEGQYNERLNEYVSSVNNLKIKRKINQ